MPVKGIDISNHQGHIDWAAVAAEGYNFAFIKATEGVNFTDRWFSRNWAEAKAHGLARGAYHFMRPFDNPDARTEADYFYNIVMQEGIEEGDMLVLDAEVTETIDYGDYGEWCLYWMQVTQSYFGFPPILYTARHYITSLNLTNPELGQYGLWLAAWILNINAANQSNIPPAPSPWNIVAFWQYTSKGSVNGIRGDVDLNLFNGSIDRLPLYGMPKKEEPQPQPIDVAAIEAHLDTMDLSLDRMRVDLDLLQNDCNEIRNLLRGTNTPT